MTDIRAKGFDSPAQLREHLAEIEEAILVSNPDVKGDNLSTGRQLAALRREVADLRGRLVAIRGQADGIDTPLSRGERHAWLRIAAIIAVTCLLGRLVQRLRLGASGAAAVPMIATQLDRRIWY
ncbi:hypothetical protein [Sinorhizobium sp. RAC02]|uniref:hypothetical protein n=1 Tax=Sinorhizobium sp. RAC02 TaxID=1842534 RepID=UPI000859019D|nr:hypothetical protein [Sinorhizobium sp. RAC02]AOF93424.1 hypothetical protein BSY16_4674 [Sinorhizobium sp. RAC02]